MPKAYRWEKIEASDVTDDTYYHTFDCAIWRRIDVQYSINGGAGGGGAGITVTFEGRLGDDAGWEDVGTDVMGVASLTAAVGASDSGVQFCDTDKARALLEFRLVVVADSGNNTCDYTFYVTQSD